MAEYTFTTTPLEDDAITAARLDTNRARAGQDPPLPPFDTNAEFVAAIVRVKILGPEVMAFVNARMQLVANAYRTATVEDRAAAEAALHIPPISPVIAPSR